jgi:hypothetical protein
MTAATYNITIEQGASWPDRFIDDEPWLTVTDDVGDIINLSGYSAEMVFSENYDAAPFITLNTDDGGIVIDGANGGIQPEISAVDTAQINVFHGVYELKIITPDGLTVRLLNGAFQVSRGF